MPVTSHQISGMIGGQTAMFGNAATYSTQISPFGKGGMPSYGQPNMGGINPTNMSGAVDFNAGSMAAPGIMNGMASFGAPMLAGAGMMMGGPIGGMLDPFTGGMRGFGAGVGWQRGAGIVSNFGNIARGGFGGIARGLGGAALGALPGMAIGAGIQYVAGQAIEGAQFQNRTNAFLQNTFRHTNSESETGYGFGQSQQRQIGRMMQEMGGHDMMTTPQELLNVMKGGAQMGVFRGVQDAREFKEKFTQMKNSLKEIAGVFNTTLSEAMPFFQGARQQGFWTPQDITRHANQVKAVQANTGMSAAQTQQMMGIGAQMVRNIGGTGQQGSQMMARAQGMTGAALFGGTVTSSQLQEAGFGSGAQGAQNLGTMLAGATARFASSRVGRWGLASMMNKSGTGLDQDKLDRFTSGNMSIGEIGSSARGNVSGSRAYDFVQNEEHMRGQLAAQGPQAGLGIVKSLLGGRLYGTSSRDKLIANRMIRRFMGGNKKQAELIQKLAVEMPRLMEIQAARSETALDAQQRQQDAAMNDTFEGMKQKVGHWWEENVTGAIKKMGADFSSKVGYAWSRASDKLWGTGGRGGGLQHSAVRALSAAALTGDSSKLALEFGTPGGGVSNLGAGGALTGGGVSVTNSGLMNEMGFGRSGVARMGGLLGALGILENRYSREDVSSARGMMSAMQGRMGRSEASALGYGSEESAIAAGKSSGAQAIEKFMGSGEAQQIRAKMGMKLDNEGQMRLAKKYLARIRSGAAGEDAQAMVSGVDDKVALTRIIAFQGEARGKFSGVEIRGMIGSKFSQMSAAQLDDAADDTRREMVAAMTGGGGSGILGIGGLLDVVKIGGDGGVKGEAVTEAGIRELESDPDAQRAFKLMAQAEQAMNPANGQPNAEAAEKLRAEARGLLIKVGNSGEKGGLSAAARSFAVKAADGKDPKATAIAKLMADRGGQMQSKNALRLAEGLNTRMERIRGKLGKEGMSELLESTGDKAGLNKAIKAVLNPGANETAQGRLQKMKELAQQAATNPKEAARIHAILNREGAANTDVGILMKGAIDTAGDIKKFAMSADQEAAVEAGGGNIGRARASVASTFARMGIKLKDGDLDRLIRGDTSKSGEAAKKRLEEKLRAGGMDKEQASAMLRDVKGGFTAKEILERGTAAAQAAGFRTFSEKVSKEAGLKPDAVNITGKEGSPQEMGQQLKLQTTILRDIALSTAKSAKRESGVVQNKKGKK